LESVSLHAMVIVTTPFSVGELVQEEKEKHCSRPDSEGGLGSYGRQVKHLVNNRLSQDVNEGRLSPTIMGTTLQGSGDCVDCFRSAWERHHEVWPCMTKVLPAIPMKIRSTELTRPVKAVGIEATHKTALMRIRAPYLSQIEEE
jgi:hypothetical protein